MPLYIELLHGRTCLGEDDAGGRQWEQLNGWGADGPVFGPFDSVNCTYMAEIRLGEEASLEIIDGLVVYDGVGYGDWSVVDAAAFRESPEMQRRHQPLDPRKTSADELNQAYVVVLAESGEDSPLYRGADGSWSADIDCAAALTLAKARDVARSCLKQVAAHDTIHVGRLRFTLLADRIVRSETPIRVETAAHYYASTSSP